MFKGTLIALLMFLSPAVFAFGEFTHPLGGSSVPWPWPWAKECPIDFESLNGTYTVQNSDLVEFIQIESVSTGGGGSLVLKIRLFDKDFDLMAEGETGTYTFSRSIFVPMHNVTKQIDVPGLRLQIYHRNENVRSCLMKDLIPILSVSENQYSDQDPSQQMVLEPMSNWDEENP